MRWKMASSRLIGVRALYGVGNASFTITSPYKCSLISNDKINYICIRFHKLGTLLFCAEFQLSAHAGSRREFHFDNPVS